MPLAPQEQDLGKGLAGKRAGRGHFHRSLRGRQSASQRIGPNIESEPILVAVEGRQHGPAIAVIGRILHGALQQVPHGGMLLLGHAFVQAEDPEHRFIGAQLRVAFFPDRRADAARQDAMLVGDG